MIPSHLLAHLAYVLPLALLAWLAMATRGRSARILVLLALPVFYVAHYRFTADLAGWPSAAPLPDAFRLLGSRITEPDRQRDTPGEILLWVEGRGQHRPRVHALPYDKQLHQDLSAAQRRQADGRRQIGERAAAASVEASGAGGGRSEAAQAPPERIRFRDENPPRPPPKGDA